jgi:hypothetical protein
MASIVADPSNEEPEQPTDSLNAVTVDLHGQNGAAPASPSAPRPAPEDDPLLRWLGFLDSGITDVVQRHDHYLGQAQADEMRRDQP